MDGTPVRADAKAYVCGLGVVEGWRFVCGQATSMDTFHLMSAATEAFPRRQPPHFLEHRVVASAAFPCDDWVEMPGDAALVWGAGGHPPRAVPPGLLQSLMERGVRVTRGGGTIGNALVPVRQVLDMWSLSLAVCVASPLPWALWTPLACALARGLWSGDATPLYQRVKDGASLPGIHPSTRQLQAFMATAAPPLQKPAASGPVNSEHSVLARKKGAVQAYSSEHRLNAVRLGQHPGNQANVQAVADAALRYLHPGRWQEHKAALVTSGHRMPGRKALRLGRIRLDCSSMLLHRHWYRHRGPTFRYLGIDASPQRPGQEVLVCVERVICRSEVGQKPRPPVEERRLPPSTLGHGRCGLAEKVQATVHQTWLDYGPSLPQTRAACHDVRQILSDMGTEAGIADYGDVLSACISRGLQHPLRTPRTYRLLRKEDQAQHLLGATGQPEGGQVSFMFPLALYVPGPQHILDNLLRDSLRTLVWWPEWQAQAKVVCQWLSGQGHREFLQQRLPGTGKATPSVTASLDTGCDHFAEWRWQTLSDVTRALCRMEGAVRGAMASITDAADLGTRDSNTAKAFVAAVVDHAFWDRARAFVQLLQPVRHLSGWLKGCDCHGGDLVRGAAVSCPWKGCRAKDLASRLDAFSCEMQEMRADALDGKLVALGSEEVVSCINRMLAYSALKFAWVKEPPYLIWNADRPEVAKQFLDHHDADIRDRRSPHRVTAHFAGTSSLLRRDMEELAAGRGMTARLREEILSYQFCKLDDTWVEASHRDLSGIGRRKPGSKMPFRFATLRLDQNLRCIDDLDPDTSQLFHTIFTDKWRGIARAPGLRRPQRLVIDAPWAGVKDILAVVYRQRSENWLNWTAAFKDVLDPSGPAEVASMAISDRMKVEFLNLVWDTPFGQQVCSLPVVSAAAAARARAAGDVAEATAILTEACCGNLHFFRIIMGGQVRRKKLVRGAAFKRMIGMSAPVMMLQFGPWAHRGADSWDVYPEGSPAMTDFLHLAEWPVIRAGLRSWKQGPSDTSGCVQLSGPAMAVNDIPWDIRSGPVPTVILLGQLVAQGWRKGALLTEHTLDSPQTLRISNNPMAHKAYLQCILCLPALLSGAFPALPVGQPTDYYTAVLLAGKPEDIRIGQPAQYYKCMLKGQSEPKASMVLYGDNAEGMGEEDTILNDLPAGNATAPGQRRPCKRKRPLLSTIGDSCLAGGLGMPQQPFHSEDEVTSMPTQDMPSVIGAQTRQSASSTAQVGADISLRPPGLPVAHERASSSRRTGGGYSQDNLQRCPREHVAVVLGTPIVQERHLLPGEPGHYHRMAIRCQLPHHSEVAIRPRATGQRACPCGKFRSCGPRQTALFGHMEPAAFLAAWLRKGHEYPDKATHMRHVPSNSDIEFEMREQGWLLP